MSKSTPLAMTAVIIFSSLITASPVIAATPDGRLLASQCFQCHGANGKSVSGIEGISGESASEIFGELKEMQLKAISEPNIMHSQAKIYSDEEIKALSAYLSKLPR